MGKFKSYIKENLIIDATKFADDLVDMVRNDKSLDAFGDQLKSVRNETVLKAIRERFEAEYPNKDFETILEGKLQLNHEVSYSPRKKMLELEVELDRGDAHSVDLKAVKGFVPLSELESAINAGTNKFEKLTLSVKSSSGKEIDIIVDIRKNLEMWLDKIKGRGRG
jgi:hypothetical protein